MKVRTIFLQNRLRVLPILFLIVMLSLASCTVGFKIIDRGTQSGRRFENLYFEAITDASRFTTLFNEIHSIRLPPAFLPKVDFQSSIVLFVSMGEQASTGYQIEIDRIRLSKETLVVSINLKIPHPDEMQATMITNPYLFVLVDTHQDVLRVEWIDRKNVRLHVEDISPPRD